MKAYLIPGWGEDLKSRDYASVLKMYKELGYEPEFITIDWNYKTIKDWVEEVKAKLSRENIRNSILSGFSFGAVTALSVASDYQNPKKLLLFSLSCYYADDQAKLPKWWLKAIGKRRVESFKKIDFDDLAERINCPTDIFVGTKEGGQMENRAKDAHNKISNSNLFLPDSVGHDVADPKYVEAIREALK